MTTERFPYRARSAALQSYPPAGYLHEHEAARRQEDEGRAPDTEKRLAAGRPVWRYEPLPRTIQE